MSSLIDQVKIERHGLSRHSLRELYYSILKMSWTRFLFYVALTYTAINAFFAFLFTLQANDIANSTSNSFWDAFVFSNQTFATIGFGYYLPITPYAHVLVYIESILSTLFTAITTGLTFAKFARPTPHIIFSNKVVITSLDDIPTLMFRLGNGRDSNIVDAKITVLTLVPYKSKEGITLQRFVDVKLERDQSPFFLLTWTVMHKVTEGSPFYNMTHKDFLERDVELFVSLTGYDEAFSQTIHAAHRYQANDVHFSKRFADVISFLGDGTRIDFTKFHDVE
ncbi:MAG: hypothetical protein A4S09_12490 [Proteobacteria bacterium SG_bin7]|nr:MAG: hypothetical protein A4S09_12490 [Proteobacteria bacterium SG_bin7]